MTAAITPTSWFPNNYIHSRNETVSKIPSRLEIVFVLGSGGSFLVYIILTCMFNIKKFNLCKLFIILDFYLNNILLVICFSSIEKSYMLFRIYFALADFTYTFLGTSFFDTMKKQSNFNYDFQTIIQGSTRNCFFTTLTEKNSPLFSGNHENRSKKSFHFKSCFVQFLHFQQKKLCCFKLKKMKHFSLIYLNLIFNQNWNNAFQLWKNCQKFEPSCSISFKNESTNKATIPVE